MKLRYLPLAAVAGLALLTGCGGTPAADPTASPTAVPTETSTPEPVEPELASMLISSTQITAEDVEGNRLAAIDYFDEISDTVTTLSDLFGFKPIEEVVAPRPSDAFSGTTYDWEGFTIYWTGFEDQPGSGISEPPQFSAVRVVVTVPSVREVAIVSIDEIQVGDDINSIADAYPDFSRTYDTNDGSFTSAFIDYTDLPPLDTSPDTEIGFAVSIVGRTDEGVSSMLAPAPVGFGL